jgi:hypothetical protein
MKRWLLLGGLAMLGIAATARAAAPEPPVAELTAAPLPDLTVPATEEDRGVFDKYFFFHQDGVSFGTALADILECDALASGYPRRTGRVTAGQDYLRQDYSVLASAVGGALGSAIGNALGDAIFGSAGARVARRISMRNCMAFKGYRRHGLPKSVWESFNFEEGGGRKPEDERNRALVMQARVASGPKPALEVLKP